MKLFAILITLASFMIFFLVGLVTVALAQVGAYLLSAACFIIVLVSGGAAAAFAQALYEDWNWL